jgi:hypothetical protein
LKHRRLQNKKALPKQRFFVLYGNIMRQCFGLYISTISALFIYGILKNCFCRSLGNTGDYCFKNVFLTAPIWSLLEL